MAQDDPLDRSEMPDSPSCRTCPDGQPRVQLESSDDAIKYRETCGVSGNALYTVAGSLIS